MPRKLSYTYPQPTTKLHDFQRYWNRKWHSLRLWLGYLRALFLPLLLISRELLDRLKKIKRRSIDLKIIFEGTQYRWLLDHRWRQRSDQSQNVWQFVMFGFVVHYSRMKWKKWIVSGTPKSTILNFLWSHFRSRSSSVTRSKIRL